MGDDPTQGIQEILQSQQNRLQQPKVLQQSALLPPIGGRSQSSLSALQPTVSRRRSLIHEAPLRSSPSTLAPVRGDTGISRATTARTVSPEVEEEEKDTEPRITMVPLKIAELPSILPAIPGLSTAVDNLSSNRLANILEACQLYDSEGRGYLSQPTVLKCIGEAHAPNSPWREFLEELAPHGEFIHYGEFLELVQKHRDGDRLPMDPLRTIPDVLGSRAADSLMNELPSRPTSSQATRERGRAEIVMEIENLLVSHPELDIDVLKMVTQQKVMEKSEMLTLLELYGFLESFRPFLDRLIHCFRTFDDKFHYSAFVGCLHTIGPISSQTRRPPTTKIPRPKTLPPLSKHQ